VSYAGFTERPFDIFESAIRVERPDVSTSPRMNNTVRQINLEDGSRVSEIVIEAAKLFAAKGYDGTSIRDIARAVGVTQASLYHFFADKQEIHSTVVMISVERLLRLVRERLATCTTAAERVEGFARAHAQHISDNAPLYFASALGYGELTDPVMKARVQRMRDAYEEILRGIVRDGIEDGEFRELDVKLAARAIISCLNWMARWWRADGPDTAETIASEYVKLIIRGFLPD
jgi:AcrR family transcriptional regulator